MSNRSVVVLAPNSFARLIGSAVESQFHLMLKGEDLGSLRNLDVLFNSPLKAPRLDNGFQEANPMAGYYLESFLKLNGYDAHAVFDWNDDLALERALASDPVAIALSTTYITDNVLLEKCIETLRTLVGDLPILVGGPYIWKQKQEFERDSWKDARYIAEAKALGVDLLADCLFAASTQGSLRDAIYIAHEFGEYTMLQVLAAIVEGKSGFEDLSRIPNLVLSNSDSVWYATPAAIEPTNLDEDFTHWDLIDKIPTTIPIRASVGCPFRCRYCDFVELHPKVLMRSPQSIVREIRQARKRGGRVFGFIDDNIFLSKKRITQLTTAVITADLNIAWGGFFRVDRVDESNIDALVASGCRFGLCGIESADELQLKRLRKGCVHAEVERGIELATAAGINLNLSLLIGFPGETEHTLNATIDALNRIPSHHPGFASWLAYPFYLLPNTAADDLEFRRKHGLVGRRRTWRHDTMTSSEAENQWANHMFKNVTLPYHYYTGDVPPHWSIEDRSKAIDLRRDLTIGFLNHDDDARIQRAFNALYTTLKNNPTTNSVPTWSSILAERELQPGARGRYRGAFEQ